MVEFKRIVLTTDLSDNASEAVPFAIDLAKKYGGAVTLLHVVEDSIYYASAASAEGFVVDMEDFSARIQKDREDALKAAAAKLSTAHGVTVTPVLRTGHAAGEIIAYAKEAKPDVVVIATHGRSGFQHLIFGSVAEKVIRLCPVPVLSVRPKAANA
jgi:nucleotide-binding universal stress UspA family protein